MTSTKQIQLTVPKNYQLDTWYDDAKPDEIALVLEFASRIPKVVANDKDAITTKLLAARSDGTSATIGKILVEASQQAEVKLRSELTQMQLQLHDIQKQRDELQESNKEHEKSLLRLTEQIKAIEITHTSEKNNIEYKFHEEENTLKHSYEQKLMEGDHALQMELAKLKAYETHLEETSVLKMDALKREVTVAVTQQYENMREEFLKTRTNYEQLLQETETKVEHVCHQEKRKAEEHHFQVCEEFRTIKADLDSKLLQTMTEKCQLNEDHINITTTLKDKIATLSEKIVELQNPMGRGNAGEFDVAQTLKDIGYSVEDTSDGEKRDAGYLDLMVKMDDSCTENMRIAVEVKNKKTIKKASDDKVKKKEKDVDDDVKTFQQRAKNGIANGLFDAAVFVSIRAHTKMGAPVVLEMYEDATNRPLAPVSYIGPEKGKGAPPLTQEQLETQMYMMFCILDQCHTIRRELCNGLKDEEVGAFQTLFEEMGSFLNKTFSDLRKQEQLIQDMVANLNAIRCKCIKMFRSIYNINGKTPWLQRKLDVEWVHIYESARERAVTMKDSDVWNAVSKQKATIENTIGKEAMLQCIRAENSDMDAQNPKKKLKTDDLAKSGS